MRQHIGWRDEARPQRYGAGVVHKDERAEHSAQPVGQDAAHGKAGREVGGAGFDGLEEPNGRK